MTNFMIPTMAGKNLFLNRRPFSANEEGMIGTARDYEIPLPQMEGLTPTEAISRLCGIANDCLEQIGHLREENRLLREENNMLKEEIASLKEENTLLKSEVKELRSRLNMDSHNSNKPPSLVTAQRVPLTAA